MNIGLGNGEEIMKSVNTKAVTIALFIATFLTAIEGTIVSTAMPIVASELQGIGLMNWVFSIYLLTSAVTIPIFGKLSDLFGRKNIFIYGTIVFLIGSTLCGLSQSMEQLIIFRAIQGIGAGAIMPVTMTIIGDIYPFEKRAKMLGIMGMAWGIAGVVGPLIGGFFVDQMSWHWIFYMNIPFGIASIGMVGWYLKENIPMEKKSIDYLGAIVFSAAVLLFLYTLQQVGSHQWSTFEIIIGFFFSFLLFTVFVWIELKAEEPMIPIKILSLPAISVGNAVAFLASVVLIGTMVYIPMWAQGVLGKGATESGLMLAPMSLTWMVGSFIGGRMLLLKGERFTIASGMSIIALAVLWMFSFTLSTPSLHFYLLSAVIGLGFGTVITITSVTVQSAVDFSKRGVATASNTFFRTIGQSIGSAFIGIFFNIIVSAHSNVDPNQFNELINSKETSALSEGTIHTLKDALVYGIHYVFLVLLFIAIIGMLTTVLLPKKNKDRNDHNETANVV